MRVGIDGKCLLPPRVGVARYLEGVLAGIAAMPHPDVAIEVRMPATPRRTLPWVLWDVQRATGQGFAAFHMPFYYPPLAPRCPVTVAIHDVLPIEHPEWFPRRLGNTLRMLIPGGARRAAAVVTFAASTAETIVRVCGVARERVRVIPHGLNAHLFTPAALREVDDLRQRLGLRFPYLLQLGALEPRRGIDLALEAVDALRSRHGGLELVLAGSARATVPWLASPPSWVRRLGWVEDADLPALLAGAEVVLAPSRGEGFDFPVLEALACGAPVVASDIPVHVEHFAPAVELFASGDAEALADTVGRLLADSGRAAALRAAGPPHAARFTWEASARAHLDLWREVAS